MPWLAVQFPHLGVELRERAQAEAVALALVGTQGSAGTIVAGQRDSASGGLADWHDDGAGPGHAMVTHWSR